MMDKNQTRTYPCPHMRRRSECGQQIERTYCRCACSIGYTPPCEFKYDAVHIRTPLVVCCLIIYWYGDVVSATTLRQCFPNRRFSTILPWSGTTEMIYHVSMHRPSHVRASCAPSSCAPCTSPAAPHCTSLFSYTENAMFTLRSRRVATAAG